MEAYVVRSRNIGAISNEDFDRRDVIEARRNMQRRPALLPNICVEPAIHRTLRADVNEVIDAYAFFE